MGFFTNPYFLAIAVDALALGALYFFFERIGKKYIAKHSWARQLLAGSEVVFAVLISAVGGFYDVFKKDSWTSEETAPPLIAAAIVVFFIGAYCLVKIFTQWNKDQETTAQKDLKTENTLLTSQRDVLRRVLSLTDQVVEKKMTRIRESHKANKGDFRLTHLMEALDPRRQIDVILTALHYFTARLLQGGMKLRLGVYLPVDGYLKPIYSFDGTTENCFSPESQSCMKIHEPNGPQSTVTQLFHSAEKIKIISNCEDAVKTGGFTYLRKGQERYLKSLVVVKKVINPIQGKEVIILAMDTDQPGFFKQSDREDIELCCDTVMKRLEFEMLALEVKANLKK